MNGIGLTVNYRSGEMVTSKTGTIEQARRTSKGTPEYFVRWADGTSGWFLAANLKF